LFGIYRPVLRINAHAMLAIESLGLGSACDEIYNPILGYSKGDPEMSAY